MLCGQNAVHPAGAPLNLIDQVGPRRQRRQQEVNLKATCVSPCGALTAPAYDATYGCIAALAAPCSCAKCMCLVMCCRV